MSLPKSFASSMHICSKRFSKIGGVRGEPDKRRAAVLLCKPAARYECFDLCCHRKSPG